MRFFRRQQRRIAKLADAATRRHGERWPNTGLFRLPISASPRLPLSASPGRAGYTLMELIVSALVSSILMAGLGSTIYIATRAGDPDVGSLRDCQESSAAAFDITAELQFAQSFTERTATSVKFTVADRNGDTNPETIRYAWSGTPGDPLTRQFNGGAVIDVVQNVYDFNLDYQTKSVISTSQYFLISTRLTLQVGADTKARMHTSIDVLNRPEVSSL
jgi:hypothetical protein